MDKKHTTCEAIKEFKIMNSKCLTWIAIFLVMLLVAACGGAEAASMAVEPGVISSQEITVEMHDIYYGDSNDNVANPPEWTVTSGAEVTVRMANQGALEHTFVVLKEGEEIPANFSEDEHSDKVLFSSGIIAANESGTTTFTAPAPGDYNIVCTILGHSGLMHGRLIVTE